MVIFAYSILVDHDMESCGSFIVILSIVAMLFVIIFTHNMGHIDNQFSNVAVLPPMSICPPCMGIHRCKTVVVVHLYPLPFCLPLRRLLACSIPCRIFQRHIFSIRADSMPQGFPWTRNYFNKWSSLPTRLFSADAGKIDSLCCVVRTHAWQLLPSTDRRNRPWRCCWSYGSHSEHSSILISR